MGPIPLLVFCSFSLLLTGAFAATPCFLLFFPSFHQCSLPPLLPPLLVGLYFCHHSFFAATLASPCFLQFSLLLTATFAATPCFLLFFTSFHKGSFLCFLASFTVVE